MASLSEWFPSVSATQWSMVLMKSTTVHPHHVALLDSLAWLPEWHLVLCCCWLAMKASIWAANLSNWSMICLFSILIAKICSVNWEVDVCCDTTVVSSDSYLPGFFAHWWGGFWSQLGNLLLLACHHLDHWNWVINQFFVCSNLFVFWHWWSFFPIKVIGLCPNLFKHPVRRILNTLLPWIPIHILSQNMSGQFKPSIYNLSHLGTTLFGELPLQLWQQCWDHCVCKGFGQFQDH